MRPLIMLVAALCATSAFSQRKDARPLVYDVENTGAEIANPVLPAFADLPVVKALPNPLEWSDGSGTVTDFSQWAKRRAEIAKEIQHYEIGEKPAVAAHQVKASMKGDTLFVDVTVDGRTITLSSVINYPAIAYEKGFKSEKAQAHLEKDKEVKANTANGKVAKVKRSHSKKGKVEVYPLLIGTSHISLPGELLHEMPIATLTFNERQVNGYSQFRGNTDRTTYPFVHLYPHLIDNGAYSEWAWGFSRIIDGLQQLGPEVTHIDTRHIGVTGCSYAGKMALFCGAFDERVALTIAQEPGGGGAAAWRVSHTLEEVEDLDRTDYHWFKESLKEQFHDDNVYRLPYDHHELCAMVCPRALLVLGNPDYQWLADESARQSMNAASKVWQAFGIEDRVAVSIVGGHPHCQVPKSQYDLIREYMKRFLLK